MLYASAKKDGANPSLKSYQVILKKSFRTLLASQFKILGRCPLNSAGGACRFWDGLSGVFVEDNSSDSACRTAIDSASTDAAGKLG